MKISQERECGRRKRRFFALCCLYGERRLQRPFDGFSSRSPVERIDPSSAPVDRQWKTQGSEDAGRSLPHPPGRCRLGVSRNLVSVNKPARTMWEGRCLCPPEQRASQTLRLLPSQRSCQEGGRLSVEQDGGLGDREKRDVGCAAGPAAVGVSMAQMMAGVVVIGACPFCVYGSPP
jgi:hypothetical protein